MRIAILFIAALLAGCNSSDDDSSLQQQISAIPNEATAVAALRVQVSALQTKLDKLQLIGNAHRIATAERTEAIGEQAATSVNFGPCSDMGVLIGFTNENEEPADALSATGEDFKQCTGYEYSVNMADGTLHTADRIFWDGPNCTGNILEWQAGGAGYNTGALEDGVVFASPVDGTIYMVTAGQTPQPILIQSVWVRENPGCQSDIETQLMYNIVPNDVSISGIPNMGVGAFQLTSP